MARPKLRECFLVVVFSQLDKIEQKRISDSYIVYCFINLMDIFQSWVGWGSVFRTSETWWFHSFIHSFFIIRSLPIHLFTHSFTISWARAKAWIWSYHGNCSTFPVGNHRGLGWAANSEELLRNVT